MKFLHALTIFCTTLFFEQTIASTVYVANHGMSKMVELSTKPPYCVIQKDRGKIRDMLLSTDPRRVRQMSDEAIENLEKVCNTENVHGAHQGGFIYPGTKWCGPGNVARSETDFGYHIKEDMCCREHDRCPNALARGECRQGICNNSPFTRSHCDCDAAFRKCLQNVNSETANTIGAIFFNIIQVICFKERTPCTQWQRDFNLYLGCIINPQEFVRVRIADIGIKLFNDHPNPFMYPIETEEDMCPLNFENSGRYQGSYVRSFQHSQKKGRFVNTILRKLGYL